VLVYAGSGGGPFGEGAAQAVNFRVAYEPPELGGLPPGLRELAGRCLEKDPARRPGVAELLETLAEEADAGASAAMEWLPAPVARAVRERTEAPLPATPTSPAPPVAPPQPQSPPALQTAQPALGTFGPPVPVAPGPAGPPGLPGKGLSRRGLLAVGGGTAAVVGLGALAWALSQSGDDGGDDSTSGGSSGGDTGGDTGGTPPTDSSDQATTVRIAVQAALGGSPLGENMLAAAQVAVDAANDSDAFPGLRFEIVEADDMGLEDQAAAAAQTAIDDERVLAVVGPALSGMVMVAAPLYGEAGLAAVTPTATNPALTEQGFATFLRAVPNDRQVGEAMGDFLALHPAVLAAMVVDDGSSYGVALADAVEERLRGTGYLHSRETFSTDTSDPDPVAQDIISSGADSVAFCGFYDDAAPLADALSFAGFGGVMVGADGIMDQAFIDQTGSGDDGWFVVCSCFDPSASSDGEEFARRFKEESGREPDLTSTRAFDVTATVIEAVGEVGAEADREAVFQELADARFNGIAGEVRFDPDGEYAGDGMPHLFQVNGGAFVPLGPVEDYDHDVS
jgi:branched-chain amino acid transport system substrate-binding protein